MKKREKLTWVYKGFYVNLSLFTFSIQILITVYKRAKGEEKRKVYVQILITGVYEAFYVNLSLFTFSKQILITVYKRVKGEETRKVNLSP